MFRTIVVIALCFSLTAAAQAQILDATGNPPTAVVTENTAPNQEIIHIQPDSPQQLVISEDGTKIWISPRLAWELYICVTLGYCSDEPIQVIIEPLMF